MKRVEFTEKSKGDAAGPQKAAHDKRVKHWRQSLAADRKGMREPEIPVEDLYEDK